MKTIKLVVIILTVFSAGANSQKISPQLFGQNHWMDRSDFFPRSSYYHTQMMSLNMKGEFLPTKSSNSYVKTIGSKSTDEICIMILNSDQHNNFDFDLVFNKNGDSPKPLIINTDLSLDKKNQRHNSKSDHNDVYYIKDWRG